MKELTCPARVENIATVVDFVGGELDAVDCPMRPHLQIDVAIDELFTNISQYAYAPGTGEATVRFEYDPEARLVTLTFIDRGVPYNPLEHQDPDTSLPAEEREIGGLGIFLVKKTMDALRYEHRDGCNILYVEKKI